MSKTQIAALSTYPPIMCGIGTYTDQIAKHSPIGRFRVVSFDAEKSGMNLTEDSHGYARATHNVDNNKLDPKGINEDITELFGAQFSGPILIQNEMGIFRHNIDDYVSMVEGLKSLGHIVASSNHTIHFQSDETEFGLERFEYDLLKAELPVTDGLTVFSQGVYNAVTAAFPKYSSKISIMHHGIPQYGSFRNKGYDLEYIASTREENREIMFRYLSEKKLLDTETAKLLKDPHSILVGASGFVCPGKKESSIFEMADETNKILHKVGSDMKVNVVYIGSLRTGVSEEQETKKMFENAVSNGHKFIEHFVPDELYPRALGMYDVVVFWPKMATQSGRLTHALGMGANILGRDVEGVGETLRNAGYTPLKNPEDLSSKLADYCISDKDPRRLGMDIRKRARYLELNNWKRITRDHFTLAEKLMK